MSMRQRVLHWLLSPLALVLVSFALIFFLDEWRAAESEADYRRMRAEQQAKEPAEQPLPPLFKAIRDKNPDAVRLAIARGANPNTPNEKGTLPLHYAFLKDGGWPDRGDVIEALLAGGADVNARTRGGYTALHLAASRSNKGIVELLLERGADANAATKDGKTPLMSTDSGEIADLLIARGAGLGGGIDPDGARLISAAREDDVRLVELLLARGANLNRPNAQGYLPIAAAVGSGKARMVELLLAAGAAPDFRYPGGDSLLHVAARTNNVEIAQLLIRAGADVNVAAASGWMPLHAASALCHEELAALLVASGANPGARDKHGMAPLPCYAFARKPGRGEPMRFAACR
jgi:ankyrin repeat protein